MFFRQTELKCICFRIKTYPRVVFAVKHLGCQCGIVLTVSHNPPEYNGYKVYWQDGGQIVPPEDAGIIDVIENLDYNQKNLKQTKV
jgi:phosphomannomutase